LIIALTLAFGLSKGQQADTNAGLLYIAPEEDKGPSALLVRSFAPLDGSGGSGKGTTLKNAYLLQISWPT